MQSQPDKRSHFYFDVTGLIYVLWCLYLLVVNS